MEKVVKRFDNVLVISMVSLIFEVLLGILLIKFSAQFSFNSNFVVVGVLLIVRSLGSLIRYLYDGLGNKFFIYDLFAGIVGIILGLFVSFVPFITNLTLEYSNLGLLFGIYMVALSVGKFFYSFKFSRINDDIYPLVLMTGVLFLAMGVVSIFNPLHSFVAYLVGLFLIAYSILEVNYLMLLKKKSKNILKAFDK